MDSSTPPDLNKLYRESVYPSHPILVAYFITQLYPSIEEAAEKGKSGYPNAVSDIRIPGAGDCVWQGHGLMVRWARGDFEEIDDLFHEADNYWFRLNGPKGNNWPDKLRDGQKQAEDIKPLLREALQTWSVTGVQPSR